MLLTFPVVKPSQSRRMGTPIERRLRLLGRCQDATGKWHEVREETALKKRMQVEKSDSRRSIGTDTLKAAQELSGEILGDMESNTVTLENLGAAIDGRHPARVLRPSRRVRPCGRSQPAGPWALG